MGTFRPRHTAKLNSFFFHYIHDIRGATVEACCIFTFSPIGKTRSVIVWRTGTILVSLQSHDVLWLLFENCASYAHEHEILSDF